MGLLHFNKKNYKQAYNCFIQMEKTSRSTENPENTYLARSHKALSMIFMNSQDLQEAYILSKKVVDLFKMKAFLPLTYLNHYRIALAAGYLEEAYQTLEKAHNLILETAEKQLFTSETVATSQEDGQKWKEAYLKNLPWNREIAAKWQEYQKEIKNGIIEVMLPVKDAPKRGPVKEENLVKVTLIREHPLDKKINQKIERRRQQIKRIISQANEQGAAISNYKLAEIFGCKEFTIRRDINELLKEK